MAMRTEARTTTMKLSVLLAVMALATFLAVVLAAPPARAAATFTVDSTNDASDATPGDGACSTVTEECTLRAAIEEANALSGDDVIEFAPSVEGTITLGGSELTIGSNLKVEGPGADELSVDADGLSRVFFVDGGTVEIGDLTITGGEADVAGDCDRDDAGGGIYNDQATLTLSDAVVSDNTAACIGGGILNDSGTLSVSDTTISGNAAGAGGGGVYTYYYAGGSLSVERSTISGNEATQSGGGIHSYSDDAAASSKTAVTNSTISANTAIEGFGGGIYNYDGLMQMGHSTITRNSAPAGQGDGVASLGDAEYVRTEVYSSIVSANTDTPGASTGTDVDFVEEGTNTFVSEGHNVIGDGNATAAFDKVGDQRGVSDPKLGPLQHNGGPTKTHLPLETQSSPLIDQGNSTQGLLVDQRGQTRPHDHPNFNNAQGSDGSDVGAVEVISKAAEPPPLADNKLACTIKGDDTRDVLRGTGGRDVICGLGGNDTIKGMGGNDMIVGGSGGDTISGGRGDDRMYGGPGGDKLDARDGSGGDLADGGRGGDSCSADRGDTKRNCQ